MLMVFAFSFAFFARVVDDCKTGVDPDLEFCSIHDSILTTLNYFYGGPDQTPTWWLDQIYGIVAVVVLLNVVIAIVSDAWEESQKKAGLAFWVYRVNFLAEVESLGSLRDNNAKYQRSSGTFMTSLSDVNKGSLLDRIDRLGDRLVLDKISWASPPYCLLNNAPDYYALTTKQYDEMSKGQKELLEHRCKDPRILKQVRTCRSFQRDWYWAWNHTTDERKQEPLIKRPIQVVLELIVLCLLAPLGLVTFGYFWPRRFRQTAFAFRSKTKLADVERELRESLRERAAECTTGWHDVNLS